MSEERIIIFGGLCDAIAMRQAGREVVLYEPAELHHALLRALEPGVLRLGARLTGCLLVLQPSEA
jgi:hypothetical protein